MLQGETMSTKQQMSQRMMRITADGRPFAQEFQDLFGALVTTLDLKPHRIRLQKRSHTFLSRDAVDKLSTLKLTSTNRRPDPKDPSRIYTTTTTTTFAMNSQCARSHCQKFLEARFIESLESKSNFKHDNDVWQLTAKGVKILRAFCLRLGINEHAVWALIESIKDNEDLVILERDPLTDEVVTDRASVELIFRRFAGFKAALAKESTSTNSDTDSASDELPSTGVMMVREKRGGSGRVSYRDTFNGRAAVDWIMDCTTVVEQNEAMVLLQCFMNFKLIEAVTGERVERTRFIANKTAIYALTEAGQKLAKWGRISGVSDTAMHSAGTRTSNTSRLIRIIQYPALRSLFRQYLRDTHCEENLLFYVEVSQLLDSWDAEVQKGPPGPTIVRDLITTAYGLYNTFLAPSSACELNIEHVLRNNIATQMSAIVHKDDTDIADFFVSIIALMRQAQGAMLKLMASDSVPKFISSEKYGPQLRETSLATILSGEHGNRSAASNGRSGSTSSGSAPRSASLSSNGSTVGKDDTLDKETTQATSKFVGLSAA